MCASKEQSIHGRENNVSKKCFCSDHFYSLIIIICRLSDNEHESEHSRAPQFFHSSSSSSSSFLFIYLFSLHHIVCLDTQLVCFISLASITNLTGNRKHKSQSMCRKFTLSCLFSASAIYISVVCMFSSFFSSSLKILWLPLHHRR